MKTISSILLLLTTLFTAKAQTFAPAGSEWFHSTGFSVYHSYNNGDTIIGGITCHKIVRINNDTHPFQLRTVYLYDNTDTVFAYNDIFSRFTPLFIFNVHAGDVITLPVFPSDYGYYTPHGDSSFRFTVDSIGSRLYDTATLKTVYTHANYYYASYSGSTALSYGIDSIGAYTEHIGGIDMGFVPHCLSCVVLPEDYDISQQALRCYYDPSLAIKLSADSCDQHYRNPVLTTTIEHAEITISPNPATDVIHCKNVPAYKTLSIAIADIQGTQLINRISYNNTPVSDINIAALPVGLYVLQLTLDNTKTIYRKISVLH
jgi:Secretion system C-terminal sorting domain